MARLFYDSKDETLASPVPGFGFGTRRRSAAAEYGEKIAKLIPSEVLAGYLALVGLVPSIKSASLHRPVYFSVFVFCLIITPVYLNYQALRGKPRLVHLLISSAAFPIWAYAMSGSVVIPSLYDPALASILMIVFTLVSGVIPLDR
jgi:hypothetical protein